MNCGGWCECVGESACVWVSSVHQYSVFHSSTLTSSTDSLQSDGAILSQKVYGELVSLVSRS